MTPSEGAQWMLSELEEKDILHQEQVVTHLINLKEPGLLRENDDGNQVLARSLLTAFRGITDDKVVWVRGENYWRYRNNRDGQKRQAD